MLHVPDRRGRRLRIDARAVAPPIRASAVFDSGAGSIRRRILFVTPEMSDFVKVGGLGDVSAALPRAMAEMFDVRVLIPGYPSVLAAADPLEVVGRLPAQAELPACDIGRFETEDGLVVYVLLQPKLFERPGTPYGDCAGIDFPDNDLRFARLCLAAADLAAGRGDREWRADLVHVNDWPAALAPAYLSWRGDRIPSLLTIHNLAYQGLFARESLRRVGGPDHAFDIEGVEFYGKMSFLKAGLFYASHVTTVSATYAREIAMPEFGCGLDGLIKQRASRGELSGILNGIDEDWSFCLRDNKAAPFAPGDWKGKRANSAMVRKRYGLDASRGPLFAVISRLVHQKGIDLIVDSADQIVDAGGQILLMGKGEPSLEAAARGLAARHPGRIAARIGFDEGEGRAIYAGSDFLLMPSRFEPCGLSQLYAQKCGSLPIAHRTGGLADTVADGLTGFLFQDFSRHSLAGALRRAFETYAVKSRLNAMRRIAMSRDFGWRQSARDYESLYMRAIGNRPPLALVA